MSHDSKFQCIGAVMVSLSALQFPVILPNLGVFPNESFTIKPGMISCDLMLNTVIIHDADALELLVSVELNTHTHTPAEMQGCTEASHDQGSAVEMR